MYNDYFYEYKEENKPINLFPSAKKTLNQRKTVKTPQKRTKSVPSRSSNRAVTNTINSNRRYNTTKKQLSGLEVVGRLIFGSCNLILKGVQTKLGLITLIGVSLFGLKSYLNAKDSQFNSEYAPNGEEYSGKSTGKLSEEGKKRIISDEGGLRLEAYKDSKGIWTIGAGHTGTVDGKPVGAGMKITKEKAMQIFENDIKYFENMVNREVKTEISQRWFDALVNFAFINGHLKGTELLKAINRGDFKAARQHLSIETIHEPRMKRWREYVSQDMNEDGSLKSEAQVIGKTTSAGAIRKYDNGTRIGSYTMANPAKERKYIALSERAEAYLRDVGGDGLVTSGAEGTHGKGTVSHGTGNKIDVVARGSSDESWANTAIPFIRNKNTAYVNFEDFTESRMNNIIAIILKKDPSLKNKVYSTSKWSFDKKKRFIFNYHTGGGLHLDIGIVPDAYSKKQAKSELKEEENKNVKQIKENDKKIKEQQKQTPKKTEIKASPPKQEATSKQKTTVVKAPSSSKQNNTKYVDVGKIDPNQQIKQNNINYKNARK